MSTDLVFGAEMDRRRKSDMKKRTIRKRRNRLKRILN